ncbi:CpsD/CapB family tyrosine-protein kinase [Thermobrachium celere]|uniref:CpsD/CapB family tyrosine-protein kinase n=1 Tax=Thermobrachium celere TaxID=53422 RepID=UPI001940C999|nr:CpsD/CapB family tyrosine-protein kinase [Thermobrachium celere]GFR35682.1 tyrosine protein kinase [Thermobrachium celere]
MSYFIVEKKPKSPVSEAFRTLRTNLQFSSLDKEIQTIVVTSAGPSEGKSTTIGNLALTLQQSNKSVLLIDCDLRKPSIHKKFKISNSVGMSNILIEDTNPEEIFHKYNDNLYILTAGTIPPNPAELLSTNKFRRFIENMKQKFDYILIDAPPVIAVTDAQILASFVDGVLLVVSSRQAEREQVKKAKELLEKVNANILGVVLNKVDLESNGKYSYYYYYGTEERRRKG